MKKYIFNGTMCVAVAAFAMAVMCGCSTATPASRATTATYTFNFDFGEKARNVTITNKTGDSAIASADSSGSTETQTATPTLSIPVRIDARYNDMLAQATDATRSTLSTIGSGLGAVLDMMLSGKSGNVNVTKSDGSAAVVKCEDGQCSFCEDCTP